MQKLFEYEDYVRHLSHENRLVRRWAFKALENRFANRYTDEVSRLITDEDEHLNCAALRYLMMNEAVQHAPAILERFRNSHGLVPGHCARTLGKMHYEPAIEVMLERFFRVDNDDLFAGLLDFLGDIRRQECREPLLAVIGTTHPEHYLLGSIMKSLLRHQVPEDVVVVLDKVAESVKRDTNNGEMIKSMASALGGSAYFRDLKDSTGKNILVDPGGVLEDLVWGHPSIAGKQAFFQHLAGVIKTGSDENFAATLASEAQKTVSERYPEDPRPDWQNDLFGRDRMGLAFLQEMAGRASLWKHVQKSEERLRDLVFLSISVYCAIQERHFHFRALAPGSGLDDLLEALKHSGQDLPPKIRQRIRTLGPVTELKEVLSEELDTWGDIWTVNLMGRIGSREFVPDLIRVLGHSDSLDFIYNETITALNALDESADEIIIEAIKNHELGDWESYALLEHRPYAEVFDLIVERWEEDEEETQDEMDSYEVYTSCLLGIGDPRGIDTLGDMYENETDAAHVGESLEILGLIHGVEIPELPDIIRKREEEREAREARQRQWAELDQLLREREQGGGESRPKAMPFKRETPKVGRNDPCPCGSGKKYKKCCGAN